MEMRYCVRSAVNIVNLSTPLGLLLALIGASQVGRVGPDGPARHGLVLARGYRWPIPNAPAFTVGNVVLFRRDGEELHEELRRRPLLLVHEERHTSQYAWCLGPVMIALYVLAAGVSWLLSGCPACYNPFERLAGLDDGGYDRHLLRLARSREKEA